MLANISAAQATSMLVVSMSVAAMQLTPSCEVPCRKSLSNIRTVVVCVNCRRICKPSLNYNLLPNWKAPLKLQNAAKYDSIVYELFSGNLFRIGGPRDRKMEAQSRCLKVL